VFTLYGGQGQKVADRGFAGLESGGKHEHSGELQSQGRLCPPPHLRAQEGRGQRTRRA
jgi:hypothetical protein